MFIEDKVESLMEITILLQSRSGILFMNLEEDGPRMDVEAPRQTIAFETEAIAPRCWISFLIRRGKNTSSVVEAILRKLKKGKVYVSLKSKNRRPMLKFAVPVKKAKVNSSLKNAICS